jgi:hypothetical protein
MWAGDIEILYKQKKECKIERAKPGERAWREWERKLESREGRGQRREFRSAEKRNEKRRAEQRGGDMDTSTE